MYLIWSLINTAFALLFFGLVLTLFTKGKQLFHNKHGNAIIVVFVLGVISMLGADGRDFDNTYWFHTKDLKGHNVKMLSAIVEENSAITLHLDVSFKKNDKGKLVPSSSRSDITGFISGYQWEHTYTDIDTQENGTHSYEMSGVMHWYLFGIKVYSQSRIFNGTLSTEERKNIFYF